MRDIAREHGTSCSARCTNDMLIIRVGQCRAYPARADYSRMLRHEHDKAGYTARPRSSSQQYIAVFIKHLFRNNPLPLAAQPSA